LVHAGFIKVSDNLQIFFLSAYDIGQTAKTKNKTAPSGKPRGLLDHSASGETTCFKLNHSD